MCGRYYIDTEDSSEELKQIIEEINHAQANTEAHALMKSGEIFPTNIVPVVGQDGPTLMKWGYAGYGNRVINARSETAFTKPMFRKSLLERRCLIPASGYYEWKRNASGSKSKQKFALYRAEKPLFMAGIWREEQSEKLPVFVILTREAAPGIAEIHDRMPLILPQEACDEWLRRGADAGRVMQRSIDDLQYCAV